MTDGNAPAEDEDQDIIAASADIEDTKYIRELLMTSFSMFSTQRRRSRKKHADLR